MISMIFFPPLPSWLACILYQSVLPLLLLRTNLFLHLLASSGFTPKEEYQYESLGVKRNQPFASGRRSVAWKSVAVMAEEEEKLNHKYRLSISSSSPSTLFRFLSRWVLTMSIQCVFYSNLSSVDMKPWYFNAQTSVEGLVFISFN